MINYLNNGKTKNIRSKIIFKLLACIPNSNMKKNACHTSKALKTVFISSENLLFILCKL